MEVTLWEALPPAVHAERKAAMKAEEEDRAARQAAWEAHVAADREIEMELWRDACAKAERVEEDARWMAMNAKGSMRLIYAWKYKDRVYAASEEEYLWAPDYLTSGFALARQRRADQHLAKCEAEEKELSIRCGKRPRTREIIERRRQACDR